MSQRASNHCNTSHSKKRNVSAAMPNSACRFAVTIIFFAICIVTSDQPRHSSPALNLTAYFKGFIVVNCLFASTISRLPTDQICSMCTHIDKAFKGRRSLRE